MPVETLLVILFQPAKIGRRAVLRQPGTMQQPVQQRKLRVLVALNDAGQVKLQVSRPGKTRRIPQQPQLVPVADNAPQGVRVVEIFLHHSVGAVSPTAVAAIQRPVPPYDMHRRRRRRPAVSLRIGIRTNAAGRGIDGVAAPAGLQRCRLLAQLAVAQQLRQLQRPVLAGEPVIGKRGGSPAPLPGIIMRPRIRKGGLDGIGEPAGGNAKIGGALPVSIAGSNAFQQIGGKQPALNDDRSVSHNRRLILVGACQPVRQLAAG